MIADKDKLRQSLSPSDVFKYPSEWKPITRVEASMLIHSQPIVVVYQSTYGEHAAWYDQYDTNLYTGRTKLSRSLRYYKYVGKPPVLKKWASVEHTEKVEAKPEKSKPSPATEPKTTWIEIKLIDPEGNPINGVKYRIELPNGSVKEGTLNSSGKAYIDGIDPGTCKVSFPNIDTAEWKAA
ncbi:MAG: hypothetical protein A2Y48_01665 [Nitrospirae bacterium RIFCSPLOW2_12_42_9]|nr:MAG: hypothetical protein A2Z60_04140 [Nitrospirae bacterium RIFCSPLOWO2_02_42_7]OGW61913.1 MAG: hypothetical protein A2Y48_01665 [Nitrospirae bacterium RIFCSPLOW2_12_42_9]HBI23675.1 hypothetical protein [Nitrospiraceae bacterium]